MKIAIIGAGNAGCITALELLKKRDCESCDIDITIYHDSKNQPIEKVGQGTLPGFTETVYDVLDIDWYNNPIDATIKTGILYEGWGKKQYEIFHPFAMNNIGSHFVPIKLSNLLLNSQSIKVVEKRITNPELELDEDYIFDCRGRHNRDKDDYDKLSSPINSVLLSSRYKLPSDTLTHTRAIATPNGWTFIIPNKDTISYGYLYNSNITSKQDAEEDFVARFNVSHTEHHMKFDNYAAKNMFVGERTILQGNAYGFIEPLEATAVNFYQDLCIEAMETIFNGQSKKKTNDRVRDWMSQIETFLLWHYQFGSVYDSLFWTYAKSIPFQPDERFKYIMDNLDGNRRYYWLRAKSFKNWYDGVK